MIETLRRLTTSEKIRLSVSGGIIMILILVALLAPVLTKIDPIQIDTSKILVKPGTPGSPLGTDEFGRDILSRLLYGTRPSLVTANLAMLLALFIGVTLGVAAGYFRGALEQVIMRLMDLILTFPPILLAMVIVGFLGGGVRNLILVIGILYSPTFARLTFASTIQVKEMEYVTAAHAAGIKWLRIIWRYILPNILSPIIVQASLTVASAILLESGLSFLGLGVIPPTPSWGLMIGDARGYLFQSPSYVLFPSLVIAICILSINSFGDALRDALDPRLRSG